MSVTLVLVCATDLVDLYSGTTATAVDKSGLWRSLYRQRDVNSQMSTRRLGR